MANDRFLELYRLALARQIIESTMVVGLTKQFFLSPLDVAKLSMLGFEIVESMFREPKKIFPFIFRRFITEYKKSALGFLDKSRTKKLEDFLDSALNEMTEEFNEKMIEHQKEVTREPQESAPPQERKIAEVISLKDWKSKNK